MSGKTIFITGGAGLLGSEVVKRLKNNNRIVIFDNLTRDSVKYADLLDHANVEFIKSDVLDAQSIFALHSLNTIDKPDAIVHCAAAIPGQRYTDTEAAKINRKIDDTIYAYALNGVRVLYASGSSVYANYGNNIMLTEDMPVHSSSMECSSYVWEKLQSEKLFSSLDGFISFCISSPYGVGQRSKNVLKVFVEGVQNNADLMCAGTGRRTQDFVHASDVAEAFYLALKSEAIGVFNIASGTSTSMMQFAGTLVSLVLDYMGKICSSGQDVSSDNFRVNMCIKKATKILGYTPKMQLGVGLRQMLQDL